MPKVSVIIPVYNVEDYLIECLNSVNTQTLKDIEIICINDGSTDDSLLIIEAFAEIDNRIIVFNQKNQGVGAARNRGLSYALGEYVYFMDGDDYLEKYALEELYTEATNRNADFVMFKINNFYEDNPTQIENDDYYTMPYLKRRVGRNNFDYFSVSDIALDLCVCPPGNLFKRSFIDDIRFPEGLIFEDNVFFTHALFKAKRIYFHDKFLYNRRKRFESTSNPPLVKLLDTIQITNKLLALCDKYNHDKHKPDLYYRIFPNIYGIFKQVKETEKQEFFDRIRKEFVKSSFQWEKDEYFKENLNPKYTHMYNCVLNSKNWKTFSKCMENYLNGRTDNTGRLTNLRGRF